MHPTSLRFGARRAAVAALATIAALASFVVVAPAASAALTVDTAGSVSLTDGYAGDWLTVEPGIIRCDGEPYNGWLSIHRNGANVGGSAVSNGRAGSQGSPISQPPGVYVIEGRVASCGGSPDAVHLGTYTVHSRDTAVVHTGMTLPERTGLPATFTVEVTNPGPGTPAGTIQVILNGTTELTGVPVVDGQATFTLPSLPPGTTALNAIFNATAPWSSSGALTYPVIAPESPTLSVASAPGSAAVGSSLPFELTAATGGTAIPLGYMTAATATIDGAPAALSNLDGAVHHLGATLTGAVELGDTAVGERTVTVSIPAAGQLAATSVSFNVTVTNRPATLTVAGPTAVTWGETFDVTVTFDSASGLPVDGDITVHDGATLVGSAAAASGSVTVPVTGVGVGAGRELTVTHTGATSYGTSATTFALDVEPAEWDLAVAVDQLTAGAPTDLTVTATPPAGGAPSGNVSWALNGTPMETYAAGGTGSALGVVLAAGPNTVTVTYVPGSPEYASTTITETFVFEHAATSLRTSLGYTAPDAPDTTGAVAGWICVDLDDPDVLLSAYGTTELELTLTNRRTAVDQSTSVAMAAVAGACVRGHAFHAADLAPGEYTLSASYPGNTYLAPSSATFDFTARAAPTELALATVGVAGATFGDTTRLRATLSSPVPGHSHSGTVTFTANGIALGTVDPVGGSAELAASLPAGDVEVAASYSGDPIHAAAVTTPLTFAVAQATATVDVTVTPDRVRLGETSTLTATVTVAAPATTALLANPLAEASATTPAAGAPAEGNVTFYVDGTPVGTRALVGGTASMPYLFGLGAHTVTASYSGSPDVAPVAVSASTAADVVVEAAPPGTTPAPTPPAFTDPPSGELPVLPAVGPVRAGELPRTGNDPLSLVILGAVLVLCGVGLGAARSRRGHPGRGASPTTATSRR